MHRRRFIQAVTAGIMAISTPQAVDRGLELIASVSAEDKEERLSKEEIQRLMSHDTVEDILQHGKVTLLNANNFKEKVYDTIFPSLVFFYANMEGALKRDAIIFMELSKVYRNQMNFYSFNDQDGHKKQGHTMSEVALDENITAIPSITMYSPYDLLKGETPTKNDGKVKQIDVLRGGPTADKWINAWIEVLDGWIEYNFQNKYPDSDYTFRYENSGKIHRVFK